MSNTTIQTVNFNDAAIQVVTIDGSHYVSIRSICEALSVDFSSQLRRIKRHPVLSKGVVITATPTAGGPQEAVCIPLDKLNGWLFGITSSRVKDPNKRERLVDYQRECFQVLAAHFQQRATPPAAPPLLNMRALLTSGTAPALDVSAAQQRMVADKAMELTMQAHALIQDHLLQHLAMHTAPSTQAGPNALAHTQHLLQACTLDTALSGPAHALLTRMLGTARTLHSMQANNLAEFEQAMAHCTRGQP